MKSIEDEYIFCLDYNNNEPFLIPRKIRLTKEFLSNTWIKGKQIN